MVIGCAGARIACRAFERGERAERPVGKRRANCSERVCLRARRRVGRGACEWAERVERLHGSVEPIALKAFACEWSGGEVLGPGQSVGVLMGRS